MRRRILRLNYLPLLLILLFENRADEDPSPSKVPNDAASYFSAPPSNLPVRKIYVHGRPVYVRQVFVNPVRYAQSSESPSENDARGPRRKRCPGLFPGATSAAIAPAVAGPAAAAAPAAYSSYASSYGSYPSYSGGYSGTASGTSSFGGRGQAAPSYPSYQQPQVVQIQLQTPVSDNSIVALPQPSPPAPSLPTFPAEQAVGPTDQVNYGNAQPPAQQPNYPLPECYTDDSNFMCCNNQLEEVMKRAYDELKASRNGQWSNCNVHQLAHAVQMRAEETFNTTFEVVAGVGDYASKSHFYHNLICKIERESRFILAYATPKPELEEVGSAGPSQENGYVSGFHRVWRI